MCRPLIACVALAVGLGSALIMVEPGDEPAAPATYGRSGKIADRLGSHPSLGPALLQSARRPSFVDAEALLATIDRAETLVADPRPVVRAAQARRLDEGRSASRRSDTVARGMPLPPRRPAALPKASAEGAGVTSAAPPRGVIPGGSAIIAAVEGWSSALASGVGNAIGRT